MCDRLSSLKTVSFFILSITLGWSQLRAQNYSLYNSFYFNPYLYNPAEASSSYAYVFANYRKQWMNVEGAPSIATLNYNTQIDRSRAGFGVKVSSYSRGLLNTSEALVTYSYGVPLNVNNILYFGVSGGGVSNMVDANKASDPNDPAIANFQSGFKPSANFGVKWATPSGISLGAALPQLFGQVYPTNQPSKSGFAAFDNMLFTFSYRKKVQSILKTSTKSKYSAKTKSNLHVAPLELYGLYRYSAIGANQFEVVGKYNFSDNLWLGLGYRQQYGFIPSFGFAYNQFIFGYSYEPGVQPQTGFSTGSHELQIGLRLGKEKKFRFKEPIVRSTLGAQVVRHDPRYHEKTIDDEEKIQAEDKKRFYVYVKSFPDFERAEELKKKLIAQKYNGQIFYYPKNKQFYVYTFETIKSAEATEEAKNLNLYTKLKGAKVLTIIEK
ncbi:MAG: PorP/SprF family type IX secretion system membrane protein [Cyclobacteriaceae bacterium]